MRQFLLVCAGGAVGTGARYLVGLGMASRLGPSFPWWTLTVNVVGSFFISVVMDLSIHYRVIPNELRVVLTAGVLGGFTTYSSMSYETLGFLQDGLWLRAVGYVAATTLGCLAAGMLGMVVVRLAA